MPEPDAGLDAGGGMLGKGLQLLLALGDHPDGVGLTRLATDMGLPVSTTHRLLNAMVAPGFVHLDRERKQYSLGLTVFQLSHRVALVQTLSELALPVMRRLTAVTGEQSLMAVIQGLELVYLEKIEGDHQIQNHAEVGQRGSIHSSSMGKVLLAFLPEPERDAALRSLDLVRRGPNTITDREQLRAEVALVRERGYAFNEEENEAGIRSAAAPVMGARGIPVCAICVTAPIFRFSREQLESHVPLLLESAREIEARLPRGGAPANGARGDGRPQRSRKRAGASSPATEKAGGRK